MQVPERGPGRLLLIDLLQEPEQAPLRRLLRNEGRVLSRAQMQHPEQVLFRFNERWLVRGPHIGPMPVLLR